MVLLQRSGIRTATEAVGKGEREGGVWNFPGTAGASRVRPEPQTIIDVFPDSGKNFDFTFFSRRCSSEIFQVTFEFYIFTPTLVHFWCELTKCLLCL